MRFFRILPIYGLVLVLCIPLLIADAETVLLTMEGGMEIEISHPNEVVKERSFPISVLVKNNGWEDKADITFVFTSSESSIKPIQQNEITINKLNAGGSFGDSINFEILNDASVGTHYINLEYSQILVANNIDPKNPVTTNLALPILVKEQPGVIIHTTTPESIFTNAEFPFEIELTSDDIDLKDVKLEIVPPKDIAFRGETLHTFSSIQKDTPISITSQISTPKEEIITQYNVPFQIVVNYKDDLDNEKTDSQTVSLLLRPRTFMELTTDGGIWIGNFFIAPYVSLGTIIGIPVGTLLSLAIRRSQGKKKRKKKQKK